MRKDYNAMARMLQKKVLSMMEDLKAERGWTQKQLAAELGITTRAIQLYNNGINLPDFSVIIAFCDVSGIGLDALRYENCSLRDAELYNLIMSLSPSKKDSLINFLRKDE